MPIDQNSMPMMAAAPQPPVAAPQAAAPAPTQGAIQTETPVVDPARAALVKDLVDWAQTVRTFRKKEFDRMRRDMKFVKPGKQWPGNDNQEKYEANITHRLMRTRVSSLYAKNPKAVAARKQRMDFAVWDGDPQSLMLAVQSAAGMGPLDPVYAQQVIADFQSGMMKKQLINRVGKTATCLLNHFWTEGQPTFKTQMKQMIRRTEACGVSFIQIGYQRQMTHSAMQDARMRETYDRICALENMAQEIAQGLEPEDGMTVEQLRKGLEQLQSEPDQVVREGLIYDFPKSYDILVDLDCTQLKGFVGADRVARQYFYSVEQVRTIFKKDVKGLAKAYDLANDMELQANASAQKRSREGVCVLCVWEKSTGMEYFVCEGYPDFLKEPRAPEVDLECFFPLRVLSFHDIEPDDSSDIYPPSTFQLIRSQAKEWNRSGEARREHRIASRPAYVAGKGVFGKEDKMRLATHAVSELVELELSPEAMQKPIAEVLMAKPTMQIDPMVYETDSLFTDIMRTVGEAEANFGGTSGATATESTIAEQSRLATNSADSDELDDFLSDVARDSGQILFAEMNLESVKRIAGDGAVWPEFSRSEIAEEIYLTVKAGSSGRPNKALDIANLERLIPLFVQIPGLKPAWLAEKSISALDADIDLEEAFDAQLPSITMMNAAKQPSTGTPETDPNAQGPQGEQNSVEAANNRPGPKPDIPPFTNTPAG